MLKLCPLFLEGASLYAEATTTNYMDHVLLLSCEDSITGPGAQAWDEILHCLRLELGHGLRMRFQGRDHQSTADIMLKTHLLFIHNALCFLVPIIPKINA